MVTAQQLDYHRLLCEGSFIGLADTDSTSSVLDLEVEVEKLGLQ